MKPTQSILILLSLLLISNCGEKVREEIRERFDNGDKQLLVKYKGEGGDEVVVERITYGKSGDTLFWEKPLEDFYYEKIREEIIKRFDNGDKELLVKYKGEGSDEVVVERITYNESGDTLIIEKPLKTMRMYRNYYKYGQLGEEENYQYGLLNGKQTSYYKNGQVEVEGNYIMGTQVGKWTFYNKDGSIKVVKDYKNGE